MSSSNYANLILDMGPVAFYENKGILKSSFFFKIKNDPIVYGPYDTLYSASKNYTELTISKQDISNAPNNVIYVDFRAKKRISR